MPGNPREQQFLDDLEARGGWDVIWEQVAAGKNQTFIAAGFGISQETLSRMIHKDAARVRAFRDAKRIAADVLAEEARQLADDVPEKRDAIAKVREQIGVRRWLAASANREVYGEPRGGDVTVTVNAQLHLDALRHRLVPGNGQAIELGPSGPLALPEPWRPSEALGLADGSMGADAGSVADLPPARPVEDAETAATRERLEAMERAARRADGER